MKQRMLKACLLLLTLIVASPGRIGAQSTPTATPIVCSGALPLRLAAHKEAVVTPGLPNKLRSEPNTKANVLAKVEAYNGVQLTGSPVCGEGYVWWPVAYTAVDSTDAPLTGWMAEGDAKNYYLQPTFLDEATFSIPKGQTSIRVDYKSVHFTYNGVMGKTVNAYTVVAKKSVESTFPDVAEHFEFTFSDPGKRGAQLAVYATNQPNVIRASVAGTADLVKRMVQQKPVLAQIKYLETFEVIRGDQYFHAREKYLKFVRGEGFRYIASFSNNLPYSTNEELGYYMLGLTDDGQQLVSAKIAIIGRDLDKLNSLLPETADDPNLDQKLTNYEIKAVQQINQLSPTDFNPNLDALDEMITSLEIK